jgi:uncharacterized membrane protein
MNDKDTFTEEAKGAGRVISHVMAIILGLLLLIVGAAMGVTLVLLPVALLAGIAGLLLISWGFYMKSQASDKTKT